MPIYEFKCLDCKRRFREMLPVSEYERRGKSRKGFICPRCKGHKVEQLVSTFMVQTGKKS
jgi:putative FmdB family regulatory protein